MIESVWEQFGAPLGIGRDSGDMTAVQIVLRTVVVYSFTLMIVRLGSKRFLSQATAFDTVIGIMLGSVMSRAIDGSTSLFLTMLSGTALVALHWVIAALALRFDWFGTVVKGNPIMLIDDGTVNEQGMQSARLTENDLTQALRMQNNHTDPAIIKTAYLERSGQISVIPKTREPRVVDVSVKDGVQTVRVEIE
ncbi:MAG: YetF domain-containing protein [Acidobacteriota bacterium]